MKRPCDSEESDTCYIVLSFDPEFNFYSAYKYYYIIIMTVQQPFYVAQNENKNSPRLHFFLNLYFDYWSFTKQSIISNNVYV